VKIENSGARIADQLLSTNAVLLQVISSIFLKIYIYIYVYYNLFLNKKNSKNDFYHSHSQLVGNACPESNLLCVLYSTILGNHHPTLTKKNIFVL
jgi:hypothetical protein